MPQKKKIEGAHKKGDVTVLQNVRPSDSHVKRDAPEGLIRKRVTLKEIMDLQDVRKGNSGMIGYDPHRVNGMVPVIPETNAIIPDEDGTVGVALFDPELMSDEQIKALKDSMKEKVEEDKK